MVMLTAMAALFVGEWVFGAVVLCDVGFEEAGELVEVAVGVDEADDGDEGFRVDQFIEADEVEIELADDRDHHPC